MKSKSDFAPLNELILELYRGAASIANVDFNTWALEQLQQHLHFDCAWWGQALTEPEPTVLAAHLFNVSPELLSDYEAIADQDLMGQALLKQPAHTVLMTDVISVEALYQSELWRLYGRKYQIHASMGTLHVEARIRASEFLTLWRTDRRWPFSEADRQFKQLVMPHLIEAKRMARLISIRSAHKEIDNQSWAICNSVGSLSEFGAGFIDTLLIEWPQWQSAQLPSQLVNSMKRQRNYLGKHVAIEFEPHGENVLILIRSREQVDHLTERELQIATFYASGQSSPEIATALGLAQGTVRKHIQKIYSKLNVTTKIQLLKKLNRQ